MDEFAFPEQHNMLLMLLRFLLFKINAHEEGCQLKTVFKSFVNEKEAESGYKAYNLGCEKLSCSDFLDYYHTQSEYYSSAFIFVLKSISNVNTLFSTFTFEDFSERTAAEALADLVAALQDLLALA